MDLSKLPMGAANINAPLWLLGETGKGLIARGFHATKRSIAVSVLIQRISKCLFHSLFGFIIFLYVFDSLRRGLKLNSQFSLEVSSTDSCSNRVTFCHSVLTMGCNYLMTVYPGLSPSLSRLEVWIFIFWLGAFSISHCQPVWQNDQWTKCLTDVLPLLFCQG